MVGGLYSYINMHCFYASLLSKVSDSGDLYGGEHCENSTGTWQNSPGEYSQQGVSKVSKQSYYLVGCCQDGKLPSTSCNFVAPEDSCVGFN